MKEGEIKEIINNKTGKLAALCEELNDDLNEDTIHKFRVSYKSLRSFLRMLNRYSAQKELKFTEKIGHLYHICGIIRDAQLIMEKTLKREIAIPGFTEHLEHIIARQKGKWRAHYSSRLFTVLESRFEEIKTGTVPAGALIDFIDSRICAITNLSSYGSLTDDQVHSIRKLAKDVIFLSKIVKKNYGPAFRKIKNKPINELSQLASLTGGYNDERMMLEHIVVYASELKPSDKKLVRPLITEWAAGLQAEKKDLIEILPTLLETPKASLT